MLAQFAATTRSTHFRNFLNTTQIASKERLSYGKKGDTRWTEVKAPQTSLSSRDQDKRNCFLLTESTHNKRKRTAVLRHSTCCVFLGYRNGLDGLRFCGYAKVRYYLSLAEVIWSYY